MTDTPLTATEARGYQALRGHLTTLKLAAAAEALPAVLDDARAEGLSLTAALERLLAIEVADTEARRLAGRLRFACLPALPGHPRRVEAPVLRPVPGAPFELARWLSPAGGPGLPRSRQPKAKWPAYTGVSAG